MSVILTKSKYKLGLACPRSLWTQIYEPKKLEGLNEQALHRIDEGHIVGEYAKQLYSNGIEIKDIKFEPVIEETQELLKKRVPMFEAGFMFNNCFTRPDILVPIGKDKWRVIEVKASTCAKPEHIEDIAFQKYIYENCGLKIESYNVLYLNNEYIRNGDIDVNKLFVMEDVTEKVEQAYEGIDNRVKYLLELINTDTYDENKYGKHCDNPKDCPNPSLCWDFLPKNNVFDLTRGKAKAKTLLNDCDCIEIKNIPLRFKLTEKQSIQYDCAKHNKVHIEKNMIKDFLNKFQYPLYYLDYETYNSAIPLYDGFKSYQRIPFQFSLHIQREPNGELEHIEFLAEGNKDPRPEFIKKLKESLGDEGSIVVYNVGFEKSVTREVTEFLPEYKDWFKTIVPRFIDLWDIFRNFWYYNNTQCGSTSIKYVLPTLIPEKNYSDLEIGNGGDASLQYFYTIHKYDCQEKIDDIRNHLLLYCCQDTLSMYDILEHIKKLV
jgi:hypothetical protein